MNVMHMNAAPDRIRQFFNIRLNKHSFDPYFRGVQHLHDVNLNPRYRLYAPLQAWAAANNVDAPDVQGFGNVFTDATSVYYTNFRNNIWMHAKSRMRKFFHMAFWHPQQQQRPTKQQVEQTLRFLFIMMK